jgi:hypothetical protein
VKDFVLDASVALGWLIDDPPSSYAHRVETLMINGARPVVPTHWYLEVANALLMQIGERFCGGNWQASSTTSPHWFLSLIPMVRRTT